jgi:hypothetical protein
MIVFDPEGVGELLQCAKIANDNTSEALQMLQRISDHNDWECPEKYAINDFCVSNKMKVQQLQSRADDFFNVLKTIVYNSKSIQRAVIEDIVSIDTQIMKSISKTDVVSSNTFPQENTVGRDKISELLKRITDDISAQDGWSSGITGAETRSMDVPITVVEFPDMK